MNEEILARALGKLLGQREGLLALLIPSGMPGDFVDSVVASANMHSGNEERAFHVSTQSSGNSISSERATELRSREDGGHANVLIVARQGQLKELKSLETFRHVNPAIVPAGVAGVQNGEARIDDIARAVAVEVSESLEKASEVQGLNELDLDQIADCIRLVFQYLGKAYLSFGNDDISWKDAWWSHARHLANNLPLVITQLYKASSSRQGDWESAAVHVAAGMPVPDGAGGVVYDDKKHGPSNYAARVGDRWKTGEDASLAVFEMEKISRQDGLIGPGDSYGLAALNWLDEYDETVSNVNHPVLALSRHGCHEPAHAVAWVAASEREFFDDLSEEVQGSLWKMVGSTERELSRVGFLEAGPYLFCNDWASISDDARSLEFGTFSLRLEVGGARLGVGDFKLSCKPQVLKTRVVTVSQGPSYTKVEFDLSLRLPAKGKGKWREKPYKLCVDPVVTRGNVPFSGSVQLDLLVAMPGNISFYVSARPSPGKKVKRKIADLSAREYSIGAGANQPSVQVSDESLERDIKFKSQDGRADLIVVGLEGDLLINSGVVSTHPVGGGWAGIVKVEKIGLLDGIVIEGDDNSITIGVSEAEGRPLSPIVAAAMGTMPGQEESGAEVHMLENDPRGFLEKWMSGFYTATEAPSRVGLGQVIMFAGDEGQQDELVFDETTGFHVAGERTGNPVLPSELREPSFTEQFWEAFDGLGLKEFAERGNGSTSYWPSRLDLTTLEREKLGNYLEAYRVLVESAKQKDEFRSLLYPFSAFIIEPTTGIPVGVMLGPLHPVRLAWNWSAQMSAAEIAENKAGIGVDAESLLRFIDGSTLPNCGPMPFYDDHVVALPLDPGLEEVFVTWSYLGSVKNVNARKPPPRKISGFTFPVGAVSGLDKGGVAAAINDYLRVYPYSSELRIGLYCQQEVPRSHELDLAVVSELDNLLKDRADQLPGGIRVFDSNRRLGSLPGKDEILSKIMDAMDVLDRDDENRLWKLPFEWKTTDDAEVDIRFMEEPIVDVNNKLTATEGLVETGAMPLLPLRRSHVWSTVAGSSGYKSLVSPAQDAEFPSLLAALYNLESYGHAMETWVTVPTGQALQDGKASWIIAGNANLDPHLLSAALLQVAGTDLVLWEWRPPYFPRRWKGARTSIMAARPYTVIASLGEDFKNQVRSELEKSLGSDDDDLFSDLFRELGSRGVGIASLLSMGHQQSRGAIGFYLGFRLARCWERGAGENEVRLVLPLDAVNPVFESLVGNYKADDRKKADLIFIRAIKKDDLGFEISLRPIEIKMHAATSGVHQFPGGQSSTVKQALKQLENTNKLLKAFIDVLEKKPRPVLVSATISALVETGLSLSSLSVGSQALQRDLLVSAATGQCEFRLEDGALFWFERNGRGHGGDPFLVRSSAAGNPTSQFFFDPEHCHEDIEKCADSKLVKQFIKVMGGNAEVLPPGGNAGGMGGVQGGVPSGDSGEDGITLGEDGEDDQDSGDLAGVLLGIEKLSQDDLERRLDNVVEKLEEHGVSVYKPADVEPYTEGPASILYRVQPAKGVSPDKIRSNSEVLKLELSLSSEQEIQIYTHEGSVVIDVPKKDSERYFVDARVLWKSWEPPEGCLAAPLGIDQYKNIVDINFSSSNTPHLLIGGTTGSGKSEALNTLLYGLCRNYDPSELRLLLVDPKGTELVNFEEDPHLEREIGGFDDDALGLLDSAVIEMQRRYGLFKATKKKTLNEYNKVVAADEKIPWWVLVLDEYADLTSDPEVKKKIEVYLKRLAQKARAAGIHVIIATQKPSGEVISTNLRSNLPAQLALKVKSATESRVIMDDQGAEALNGKGDAFLKADNKLVRLQCAMYTH